MSSSLKLSLIAGFAMFSMFFGSGNLVFPILIGAEAQSSYVYAILGFVITAVCVPFLGLLGIMQAQGDRRIYFSTLGKAPAFILTLLMLMLIGPFGVIPRCVSVAFGGFEVIFPTLPLWVFSLVFCLLTTILIWRRNKIVDIIGVFITPVKLGSFILLIIIGLIVSEQHLSAGIAPFLSFKEGIHQGYQTMDLVASFFFGSAIYEYLKGHLSADTSEKKLLKLGVMASLVGGLLLALCYIGFVILGARYGHILANAPKEALLTIVAQQTLGSYAVPFIAFTLAVSCLATATILATLFADFLQHDIARDKISRPYAIAITIATSYAMSLLGFQGICVLLGTILEWVYPLLIIYAIFQIGKHMYASSKTVTHT